MPYTSEAQMYPDLVKWLQGRLGEWFKRKRIVVKDTSRYPLKRVLEIEGIICANKPEWQTYDIRVDVTGFIIDGDQVEFAFIECKNQPISLRDISQLLGYSRVALPVYSLIVSPLGSSGDVLALLKAYGRYDILQYEWPKGALPRSIRVAQWDAQRQDIDHAALLPPGERP